MYDDFQDDLKGFIESFVDTDRTRAIVVIHDDMMVYTGEFKRANESLQVDIESIAKENTRSYLLVVSKSDE